MAEAVEFREEDPLDMLAEKMEMLEKDRSSVDSEISAGSDENTRRYKMMMQGMKRKKRRPQLEYI